MTICADSIASFETASERISWIAGYESETEVSDAAQQIVEYFELDAFVFGALSRTGEREHHRYLVGCAPEWCFTYTQNKWYAIDPFIDYALKNTAPALTSEIAVTTAGQQRLLDAAVEHGYKAGVIVPAHSSSSMWVGVLYLASSEGPEKVRRSFLKHRNLMRAFALEMLEWWDDRLRDTNTAELAVDQLDLDLLGKALEDATAEEAALEIGVTLSLAKSRYNQLNKKLGVRSKRDAADKALSLGLIKRIA